MNISDKNSGKSFSLIRAICKPFKALKEKYRLEIESKIRRDYLTQEEYERFCKISEEEKEFFKGEIWNYK